MRKTKTASEAVSTKKHKKNPDGKKGDQEKAIPCMDCNKNGHSITSVDKLKLLGTRKIGEYILKGWFLHEHFSCLECEGPIMSIDVNEPPQCVLCEKTIANL